MRLKKFVSALLAASIVVAGIFSNGMSSQAAGVWGEWENTDAGWKYHKDDGSYAKSEYISGWRIDADGIQRGDQAFWHCDDVGDWFGDDNGWYACNETLIIDGVECSFDSNGYVSHGWYKDSYGWRYMITCGHYAYDEWVDGYWLDCDGYNTYEPQAKWYKDSKGWYYQDSSGYREKNKKVKIDNKYYYFNKDGYLSQFTLLKPIKNSRFTVSFEYKIDHDDKAIFDMEQFFIPLINSRGNDKSFRNMIIDGKVQKVSIKNDKIYIGKKKLSSYIAKKSSINVSFKTTPTSMDLYLTLFRGDSCIKKCSIGDVTFTNIKRASLDGDEKISVKVDGKKYYMVYQKDIGELYDSMLGTISVEGDVRNASWVKALKSSGFEVNSELIY